MYSVLHLSFWPTALATNTPKTFAIIHSKPPPVTTKAEGTMPIQYTLMCARIHTWMDPLPPHTHDAQTQTEAQRKKEKMEIKTECDSYEI